MQWSRWRTWPQLGVARLLRSHNQARWRLGDNPERRLSCAGADHNVAFIFTPFRRLLDVAIVRSGDKHTRHSIAFELKAFTRPAGERDVIFFRTIHSALVAVPLKHRHLWSAKKLTLLLSFSRHCRLFLPRVLAKAAARGVERCSHSEHLLGSEHKHGGVIGVVHVVHKHVAVRPV